MVRRWGEGVPVENVNDDRLDALAQACSYWVEHMARDVNKAHEEHLEKLREADLKQFMEGILGSNGGGDKWMKV
ncbi:hypothetical protein ACD578_08915 [Microvirga sp. RSM25]|uniref:hypothetical protein n=1 Tax=Microvirga sp. RSM25 TaxID=3273802 RepID=UPI003850DEC4